MTDDPDQRLRSRLLALAEAAVDGTVALPVAQGVVRHRPRTARPMGAVLLIAVLLGVTAIVSRTGVQTGMAPSIVPASPTTPTPPSAVVGCGDLQASDCSAAASAVEVAVGGRYGPISRVELGPGMFCTTPALLFSGGGCPPAIPPQAQEWIGHAVVTFAGSPAQAYLNVIRSGGTVRAAFIGLATPPPTVLPATLEAELIRVRPPTPSGIVIAPQPEGRHYMIRVASASGQELATWEIYEREPSRRAFAAGTYVVSIWYVTVVDNVDTGARITSAPIGLCSTDLTLAPATTVGLIATFGLGSPSCTLESSGGTGQ